MFPTPLSNQIIFLFYSYSFSVAPPKNNKNNRQARFRPNTVLMISNLPSGPFCNGGQKHNNKTPLTANSQPVEGKQDPKNAKKRSVTEKQNKRRQ